MATKHTDTCLQKAGDDEPIFVLRAQDITAPETIMYWLHLNPRLPDKKRKEAMELAQAMRDWPRRKVAD